MMREHLGNALTSQYLFSCRWQTQADQIAGKTGFDL